jgi:hypothetical protein
MDSPTKGEVEGLTHKGGGNQRQADDEGPNGSEAGLSKGDCKSSGNEDEGSYQLPREGLGPSNRLGRRKSPQRRFGVPDHDARDYEYLRGPLRYPATLSGYII